MKQSSLKTLKMSTQLNMQTRHSTVRHCCCCSNAAAVVATAAAADSLGPTVIDFNRFDFLFICQAINSGLVAFPVAEASVLERQLMAAEAGPSDAVDEDEFEEQEEPPFPEPRARPMAFAELLALAAEEDSAERAQDSECTLGLRMAVAQLDRLQPAATHQPETCLCHFLAEQHTRRRTSCAVGTAPHFQCLVLLCSVP